MRELVRAPLPPYVRELPSPKRVDVPTVSKWLGHSDLATTNIYAQAIKSKSLDTKLKVDSTFAKVKTGL